jgi:hypothetical protein
MRLIQGLDLRITIGSNEVTGLLSWPKESKDRKVSNFGVVHCYVLMILVIPMQLEISYISPHTSNGVFHDKILK